MTDAERKNQKRFESSLNDLANGLKDGESKTFHDHWDRVLTAGVTTELYYASGTSTITSTGDFTRSRSGDVVTIEGTVKHHWWDPYDWHEGLGAYIPGFGNISDDDALLMQKYRGAKPFQMEADWTQTVKGTVIIRSWWFNSKDYTWIGP